MDFTIFLEHTFSRFQDKNICLTVRERNIVHVNIDMYCFKHGYNNKILS